MTDPNPPAADEARTQLSTALVNTAAKDGRAFRTVYILTSVKLFGICMRICGDRQAAEDVLHEVYISVWNNAAGYQPARASPISWLATIARNRSIDWLRARRVRPTSDLSYASDVADITPLAREQIIDAQSASALHRHLDTLEPRQRDAIRAAFFEGLTYSDLADRYGVPLGTMKSWIRRGLLRLRERLNDDA